MKRLTVLYAILLPAYPVLFLYSHNNGYLSLNELFLPLAIILLGATIMLGLLKLISRNSDIASALTAFWGLWFLSYGHLLSVDNLMQGRLAEFIVRHALWVWLVVFVLGTLLIIRLRNRLLGARTALFVIAVVLVGMTSLSIARFEWSRVRLRALQLDNSVAVASAQYKQDTSNYPDIYYIILDGYARPDVFEELYGESNERFVNFLEKKGFIIAKNSHTNYYLTLFSIGSSLNMHYMDELADKVGRKSSDLQPAKGMLKTVALLSVLREKGYIILTNYQGAGIEINGDINLGYSKAAYYAEASSTNPPFSNMVSNMTPLRPFTFGSGVIKWNSFNREVDHMAYLSRRASAFSFFENFDRIPKLESPRFIYSHLPSPHPPFVFNRDGTAICQTKSINLNDGVIGFADSNMTQDYYHKCYAEQYLFVTEKIQKTLAKLLAKKSSRPTVIILQSDHGPAAYYNWFDPANSYVRERLSILNAFYFSDGARPPIYDSMTPVNTFRIISNYYFKTNYPLLKDRSFVAKNPTPYDFIDVTDKTGRLPADKLPKPGVNQ